MEFEKCIQNIGAFSENAKIFCLIHKMDLVPEEKRKEVNLRIYKYIGVPGQKDRNNENCRAFKSGLLQNIYLG